VVPNAIDLRRFGQLGSARDVDVVFAGRLVHEKGPDVLLAALRHVRRPLRVVVAGDGPCRSELVNYARRAGLDVTFTGWLSATDLPALLSRAAVQVVPSRSEAQGIALLEGLAAGTPVVASRVGGIPEIVRHGENGWLVPPDDPLALARALDHALSERGALDTMRAAARDSVRVFDLQTFPKRLQREYLE
jgi:glycogen(starch) synthase